MSDDYLKIIPTSPDHVPPQRTHEEALTLLESFLPDGEEFQAEIYDEIEFIDQGENIEAVICPACKKRLELEHFTEGDPITAWWYELSGAMEETAVDAVSTKMPCCGRVVRALDLKFDWPAGFARFELNVMNPNVVDNLTESQENYPKNNPNNESRFIFPIDEGAWQNPEDSEVLADTATEMPVRAQMVSLPSRDEYAEYGITLDDPDAIFVFETCRFLAAKHRDAVLATDVERRMSVPPDLDQILVLDEWAHPDIVDESIRPSSSETFQQLATVLVTGNVGAYKPTSPPNTHWSNWPDGGTL